MPAMKNGADVGLTSRVSSGMPALGASTAATVHSPQKITTRWYVRPFHTTTAKVR